MVMQRISQRTQVGGGLEHNCGQDYGTQIPKPAHCSASRETVDCDKRSTDDSGRFPLAPMMSLALLVALSLCIMTVYSVNPVLKLAGKGMGLISPVFAAEAKLQASLLGAVGKVDVAEVRAELDSLNTVPLVVYTYGLSPFSTEALSLLDQAGAKYEKRELGPEWFLLGPRESVLRAELESRTGQSSLPHIFLKGESIGGLSTGTPGLAALVESGELEARLKAAKAL
jgi:hypothetical protein